MKLFLKGAIVMKQNWITPEVSELDITATANGNAPSMDFDADWQQDENGRWFRPGADVLVS